MANQDSGVKCVIEKLALNSSWRKWLRTSNGESGSKHLMEKVA